MVSIPKIVGIMACGFLLCLGLSNVAQAAEKPQPAERMKADPSADRKGSLPDVVKPSEDTLQGINTITGDVLRIEGENFIVQRSDGKEVQLHTDATTQMPVMIGKGDRIKAKVNAERHALAIWSAE